LGPGGFGRAFRSFGRNRRKPLFSGTSGVFNRPKKQLDIKSCGPGAPMLAPSFVGGNIREATVAKKPVTGESAK
jgi:hypothetical protein